MKQSEIEELRSQGYSLSEAVTLVKRREAGTLVKRRQALNLLDSASSRLPTSSAISDIVAAIKLLHDL